MRISPYVNQNMQNINFKKWVEREYTEKVEHDRYPDNPDYRFVDYEIETYTKTEWFPEFDDYYSEETIKEDAAKYRDMHNQKQFLNAIARERIIEGNKKAHAKPPKFHIFSVYRYIAKDYVKRVQEYLKNNN